MSFKINNFKYLKTLKMFTYIKYKKKIKKNYYKKDFNYK